MAKLVSVAEMRAIEKAADAGGFSYAQMMENAGRSLANSVIAHSHQREHSALGLVGSGNNGGDTLVALAALAAAGWKTAAYFVGERDAGEFYLARLRDAGGEIVEQQTDANFSQLAMLISRHNVLLDGLLGTGIRLPLREPFAISLQAAKDAVVGRGGETFVVAVDCPSGLDCNSGEVAPQSLKANLTVSMAAIKRGMLTLPAFEYLGELEVGDIGLPGDLPEWAAVKRFAIDEAIGRATLPARPLDAHKGMFGAALIVAGSQRFPGAALLASKAAYRSGAGLVTVAVPRTIQAELAGHLPEATWLPLPAETGAIAPAAAKVVRGALDRVTSMLVGPGFGQQASTGGFLGLLLKGDLPALIIDADGLKLLAGFKDWPKRLPKEAVLTPHPGEMAILTGMRMEKIQAARIETAEKFAKTWKQIVVLKGAFTIVAAPDGRTAVLPLATPALARAGTGDVLAGIITGLRAQGMPAFEAACAGVWLHGQAGLRAAARLGGTAGVLAGDLIDELPALIGI
jgi:NAD(P)H-hydrate epimerase